MRSGTSQRAEVCAMGQGTGRCVLVGLQSLRANYMARSVLTAHRCADQPGACLQWQEQVCSVSH